VREECNSRVFLEALNARCRREEMGEGGEKKKGNRHRGKGFLVTSFT
jgi:hypothetical protein